MKDHYSIGEVLGLLLEEFPDVTISKIRFLESQGLIEPERTPSGYRKFSQSEVDRLRFILREQRENYLPLKVIRTKLENDTSDGMVRPHDETSPGVRNPATHPAARTLGGGTARKGRPKKDDTTSMNRAELLAESKVDEAMLREIVKSGLVTPRVVGDLEMFSQLDREVIDACAAFIALGIDVRHLKAWKVSAEREMALFEQRIVPYLQQRNPGAREQALEMLDELVDLGERLRGSFIDVLSRPYSDGR
jgi:DNA-binding transcriptional MerR regulator